MSINPKVILTNMCMLYKDDGSFLVEDRIKPDWPGLNFPGGHIEAEESVEDSVRREIKEETGFKIRSLEFVAYFEWNEIKKKERHLCLLFRSKDFEREIHSSSEGRVFFVKKAIYINTSFR